MDLEILVQRIPILAPLWHLSSFQLTIIISGQNAVMQNFFDTLGEFSSIQFKDTFISILS